MSSFFKKASTRPKDQNLDSHRFVVGNATHSYLLYHLSQQFYLRCQCHIFHFLFFTPVLSESTGMQFLIGNDTSSFSQGHTSQEQKVYGRGSGSGGSDDPFPRRGDDAIARPTKFPLPTPPLTHPLKYLSLHPFMSSSKTFANTLGRQTLLGGKITW